LTKGKWREKPRRGKRKCLVFPLGERNQWQGQPGAPLQKGGDKFGWKDKANPDPQTGGGGDFLQDWKQKALKDKLKKGSVFIHRQKGKEGKTILRLLAKRKKI